MWSSSSVWFVSRIAEKKWSDFDETQWKDVGVDPDPRAEQGILLIIS